MKEKKIQDFLFQQIKQKLPEGASLAGVVADILHVSEDSAYRRIRCETPLILEEARSLCEQYNLSLDQFFHLSTNSVIFENVDVSHNANDFYSYLSGILEQLNWVASCKEKTIIYLPTDITIFYYFLFKPVFAFRYFFWTRSVMQHPDFQTKQFSTDCLPDDVYEKGKEIVFVYATIPSTEIWNVGALNSFLLQMSNYRELNVMDNHTALEVYSSMQQLLNHIELQAEHGKKFLPGQTPGLKKDNYTIFYNRGAFGDNSILVLHDGIKTAYVNYDVLNYMTTRSEIFCNSVHAKLQLMMRKSTLISVVGEKQRTILFNNLRAKIPTAGSLEEIRS